MKDKKVLITTIGILLVLIGSIFFIKNRALNTEENITLTEDTLLAFYIKQEDGTYKETPPNGNKWPDGNYRLNYALSGCVDSSGEKIPQSFSYASKDRKIVFTTNRATFCYLYFDEDNEAPAIKSFDIDKDYTNSLTNSFYLDWEDDDVASYCITTNTTTEGCDWQPVVSGQQSITASFTLEDNEAPSTWNAFIKDSADNESELRSDNIVYDKTPPTFDISKGGGSYYDLTVKVSNEKDNLSGVDYTKIYYKRDNNAWEIDNKLTHQFNNLSQSTTYKFYVKLCDKAGNCSSDDKYASLTTNRKSLRPSLGGEEYCCVGIGAGGDNCIGWIFCD